YYGYTLYSDELNETIYQSATAIELIHKASIIIDDIIDQDIKRHGMPTVHQQYSLNEALIISVFLLGKCIEMLSDIDDSTVRLFSQMIIKMCQGTLSELNINDETAIADIRKILDNQTSQVIQNSLLIGMKSYNESINNQYLEIVGYKLGYLFQLLNDCEGSIF
ncbi:TPA: polyprenyl synthetase family protein, partial [Streptococcus suis]